MVIILIVDGQGFGLHIAEGYTQTSKGLEVKGVFVKEIVSGSPADNCGRYIHGIPSKPFYFSFIAHSFILSLFYCISYFSQLSLLSHILYSPLLIVSFSPSSFLSPLSSVSPSSLPPLSLPSPSPLPPLSYLLLFFPNLLLSIEFESQT